MKKNIFLSLLFLLAIMISCINKGNDIIDNDIEVTLSDNINHFIWQGMNAYYFWQKNVPDLADNRFSTFNELYSHFRGYSSPENTFSSLLYQEGISDRFSWIVDDYIALENSLQGINLSTGMDFGLKRYSNSATNIYGYVRYVIPNSPAAIELVERGMIFNSVNGIQLTNTNYQNLLFDNSTSINVGFVDFNDGNPSGNNTTITLSKEQIAENPVAISKVINEGSKKIGYLLYNQFSSSYDGQLNAAFSIFKAANVDDLIVDLRYNGGGSVRTATYLGSMITGQFNGQLYSKQVWNNKVHDANNPNDFLNNFTSNIDNGSINQSINSLGLSRVYFIVSGSSASASELIINSLKAYIDVKVVGTTTVGKQVGSVTLYDSENLQRDGANLNPDHTYAMQPIVLEISNKDNQNHPEGFIPGTNIPGIELAENNGNLGVLGERSDPLLDRTIIYITTGSKGFFKNDTQEFSDIYNSKLATPISNNMYVDLKN